MNRVLVMAEWKRAAECQRAAQLCMDGQCFADAAARAYYAVLHGAKAALHMRGVSADSHAAVKRLFGHHLIQTGLIEPDWGRLIGSTSDRRLMADYDVETVFAEADAAKACDDAAAFLARIRDLLLASGLAPEEIPAVVADG